MTTLIGGFDSPLPTTVAPGPHLLAGQSPLRRPFGICRLPALGASHKDSGDEVGESYVICDTEHNVMKRYFPGGYRGGLMNTDIKQTVWSATAPPPPLLSSVIGGGSGSDAGESQKNDTTSDSKLLHSTSTSKRSSPILITIAGAAYTLAHSLVPVPPPPALKMEMKFPGSVIPDPLERGGVWVTDYTSIRYWSSHGSGEGGAIGGGGAEGGSGFICKAGEMRHFVGGLTEHGYADGMYRIRPTQLSALSSQLSALSSQLSALSAALSCWYDLMGWDAGGVVVV